MNVGPKFRNWPTGAQIFSAISVGTQFQWEVFLGRGPETGISS